MAAKKLAIIWKIFMRKNFLAFAFLLGISTSFSGCVYLVIGSIGALGGYAISSDTVQGTVERDSKEVFDAAVAVSNIMGRLTKENEDSGRVEAIINNARVSIGVAQFTPKLARLTIKARKSFFPNVATAQDVYIKIVSYLGK